MVAVNQSCGTAPEGLALRFSSSDSACPTPVATIGGMNIGDQRNEPVQFFGAEELRAALEDYATTTEALMETLQLCVETKAEQSSNWWPHIAQMQMALARFRELCRGEMGKIGLWHEGALDAEEIHELVREEGERLVQWLNRMMGVSG